MELRDCQQKAIQICNERLLEGQRKTNISMCTGSGKSKVIEQLTLKKERIILVFPWLDLLIQYYNIYKESYASLNNLYYFATEGTLPKVKKISMEMKELESENYVLFTTYTSAPLIYSQINAKNVIDLVIHDEAHRTERPEYKSAFSKINTFVKYTINLSATHPLDKEIHYKYSLLRGIKDGVVRDFHMELILCTYKEKNESKLLISFIEKLCLTHKELKLLIYTAEANTEGESASSVKTFLDSHSAALKEKGWWIEGIKDDTKDRNKILRVFEDHRDVSILVSCRTLSEGIDLKNANCMLPWDPSSSVVNNIQRIGRVLRLYKTKDGKIAKHQDPSTVLIPVYLEEKKYQECNGDKEKINQTLCEEISFGERGNFRPIVNVCTALKEELAEEDADLFNRLLNYPMESKVAVNRDLINCVAKQCKKTSEDILESIIDALEEKLDEEQLEELQEGEWGEEINGDVAQALAHTQGITLVVKDGEEVEMFGKGENVITLEKNDHDGYKIVKGKDAAKDKETVQKRIAQRMKISFSDDCKIILGLDSIDGADTTGGIVLSRLTTEVSIDENWEKRRLEWVAMYEKLGKNPYAKSNNFDEKKAAQWQSQQRNLYKQRKLSDTRIEKMEQTKGWLWERESLWESKRLKWIEIRKRLNRSPSQTSKEKDERNIANWQSNQRQDYKQKRKCMTHERICILESMQGWKWEEQDPWFEQLDHWKKQYAKLQRRPLKESKDIDEKKAGSWQYNQRAYYKEKKYLTLEKINILNSTEGWIWSEDDWEEKLQDWIRFYSINRKIPKSGSLDSKEKILAQWQSLQRRNYENKRKILTDDRIAKLNSTEGWKWDVFSENWEENRQNWIKVYKIKGDYPWAKSKDSDERRAGQWQANQREQYKKNLESMTTERISLLESTEAWKWSDDSWEEQYINWKNQYSKNNRLPSIESKNIDEKRAALWQGNQRQNYKKKLKCMTDEKISILEATEGWQWDGFEDVWENQRINWLKVFTKLGRFPKQKAVDQDERAAGQWQSDMRKYYKKKDKRITAERIKILEATPGWTWANNEEPKTPYVPPQQKQNIIIYPQPRLRKAVKAKPESNGTGQKRQLSQLEEYHKRFKTMNASTYKSSITFEDFKKYHEVADTYDAKDPAERHPINKIASLLSKYNKPTYTAIDLGCGKNRLRNHESVKKMKWTSVDVHAIDDSVCVADMGSLPYEDECYDFAILSRSLWARNHMDVLKETYRILKSGGRVIVCESFFRWLNEGLENTLLNDLKTVGFQIVYEDGTSPHDKVLDVFQYIICLKL